LSVISNGQIKAVYCEEAVLLHEWSALGVNLTTKKSLEELKQSNDELTQADLKVAEMLGWTDLHLAALWGLDHEVVRLIEQDFSSVKIDVQDNNNQTPLHLAAARGRTACIQVLLEYNADPNVQDKHGWTPLHIAYFHMHRVDHPSIKLLTDGLAWTTIENNQGKTPLEVRPREDEHSWR